MYFRRKGMNVGLKFMTRLPVLLKTYGYTLSIYLFCLTEQVFIILAQKIKNSW